MNTMTAIRDTNHKKVGELTDTARKVAKGFTGTAQLTAHTVVGTPVVIGRKLADLRDRKRP